MKLRLYHHPDGARVAYREAGTGPGARAAALRAAQPPRVRAGRRAPRRPLPRVLPDLPLHGDSEDRPRHPYTLDWLAEVIAGVLPRGRAGRARSSAATASAPRSCCARSSSGALRPARLVLMPNRAAPPARARRALRGAGGAARARRACPGLDRVADPRRARSRSAPSAASSAQRARRPGRARPRAPRLRRRRRQRQPRALVGALRQALAGAAPRRELLDLYPRLDFPVLLLWADEDRRHPLAGRRGGARPAARRAAARPAAAPASSWPTTTRSGSRASSPRSAAEALVEPWLHGERRSTAARRRRPSTTSRSPARRSRSSVIHWLGRIKGAAARGERRARASSTRSSPTRSPRAADEVAAGDARRAVPDRRLPDRLGHLVEHERQRGHRRARRRRRAPQRPRQHGPVVQRRLPVSAVHLAALDEATNQLLPALKQLERSLRAQGQARSRTSSSPAARTSWTPCPVTLGQEFARLRRADPPRPGAHRGGARPRAARSRSAAPRPAPASTRTRSSPRRSAASSRGRPKLEDRRRPPTRSRRRPTATRSSSCPAR